MRRSRSGLRRISLYSTVGVLLAAMVPGAFADASPAVIDSFAVTGQINGSLVLDKLASCVADNYSKMGSIYDLRVYLTSNGMKPTTAGAWVVLISAKGGASKITATGTTTADFQSDSGIRVLANWYSPVGKTGSGKVVVGAKGMSGSVDVVLEPHSGTAKKPVTLIGSWNCA